MVKQNVGTWDAYLRMTFGLTALAYGVSRSTRRRDSMNHWLVLAGAMKVAEAVTRVCPLMYAFGISTNESEESSSNQNQFFSKQKSSSKEHSSNDQEERTFRRKHEDTEELNPEQAVEL